MSNVNGKSILGQTFHKTQCQLKNGKKYIFFTHFSNSQTKHSHEDFYIAMGRLLYLNMRQAKTTHYKSLSYILDFIITYTLASQQYPLGTH